MAATDMGRPARGPENYQDWYRRPVGVPKGFRHRFPTGAKAAKSNYKTGAPHNPTGFLGIAVSLLFAVRIQSRGCPGMLVKLLSSHVGEGVGARFLVPKLCVLSKRGLAGTTRALLLRDVRGANSLERMV